MLWNESAHVVDPEDFRLYNWSDWARLTPAEGEPLAPWREPQTT